LNVAFGVFVEEKWAASIAIVVFFSEKGAGATFGFPRLDGTLILRFP
jgi:hypothetical protein